jgi:hypothetical protein
MILQREVMKEYDETFVYKKLYSTRMDKSVQTSEGGSSFFFFLFAAHCHVEGRLDFFEFGQS